MRKTTYAETTRLVIALATLALTACGDDEVSPAPTPPREPPAAPISDAPIVEGLRVHEWGLIDLPATRGRFAPVAVSAVPGRGTPRDQLLEGAGPGEGSGAAGSPSAPPAAPTAPAKRPPRPPPPIARPRAPLLYVHLPAGHEPVDLVVRVALPGGTVEEHWPLTGDHAPQLEWVRWTLTARPETCTGASYPAPGEAPCDNPLRFYCEASELRAYETADAACLSIEGRDYNHLFYRGAVPGTFPIDVVAQDDGSLRVQHTGDHAIPGRLVRVARDDDPARTRVHVLAPPAPGATVSVAAAPSAPIDAARDAIYGALAEAFELTPPEVAAFRAAWDVALFGGPRASDGEGLRRNAWLAPRDALFYFLPEACVADYAELAIEPHPETIRRAILVRVDLDPRPRSYLDAAPAHATSDDAPR